MLSITTIALVCLLVEDKPATGILYSIQHLTFLNLLYLANMHLHIKCFLPFVAYVP